jgi:poly-gamma-glutamate capsule biosynthesis protein CapA/YwtB (metallophosphatase superfamily)
MPRLELFLCGDVMTGRGVDQILPHPSSPRIYEDYLHDARDYVELAERTSGPIARPVSFSYVWGDALEELRIRAPDARIVNLETSVTANDTPWPDKGINYRMHPDNMACLTTAKIDVCVLANNHVLDWGHRGLVDTIHALHDAGLHTAGAGLGRAEAESIAIVDVPDGRVLVVAVADASSGTPRSWEARQDRPGVARVQALDEAEVAALAGRIERVRRPGDIAVVSIHWGTNWGHAIPSEHVRFAHALIDRGIDVVHGHSSHHPRAIEIYEGKPILYGCGDLITDYEGITWPRLDPYRPDLVFLYFVTFEDGALVELRMTPMRIRKMRLERASAPEADAMSAALERASHEFRVAVTRAEDGSILVRA